METPDNLGVLAARERLFRLSPEEWHELWLRQLAVNHGYPEDAYLKLEDK